MSTRIPLLAAIAMVSLGLAACATSAPGGTSEPEAAAATAGASRTPRPVPTPTPTPTPAECPVDAADTCQIVLGTANIFGAGFDAPPAPGGGGAGTPPTMWPVPTGTTTMTVTGADGIVKPISDYPDTNGADGDGIGATNVTSYGGISGIVHERNGMFLTGVFLTDALPSGAGPEPLDFTDGEDFEELAPEVAQTFFVGDGAGRRFIVPVGATRLYLGFADAFLYRGEPGWYNNNEGQLAVSVGFATD